MSLIVLSWASITPHVSANLGTPINSGWAAVSPVINGVISPGEWSSASVRNFTLQMRSRTNGSVNRTLTGTLYVMNNRTYLFIAIQIFKDDYEALDFSSRYDGIAVLFDNNYTGTLVVGDQGEGFTAWKYSPFYSANDLYYAGGGTWDSDVDAGKTNDGALAWSFAPANPVQGQIGNWTFEMGIPLVGSDPGYDFNIRTLPHTVGYKIWFQQPGYGLDGVYPDDTAITKSIQQISNASTFGTLFIHPLYNLTISTTAGGTTNPAAGQHSYPFNTSVSVTATANSMYRFDHWVLDSVNVGSANPYQVTMNQNHTLKAVFIRLYALNIIATAGGTTNPTPGTHIYDNGTLVSVTAIPNTNYQLDHWELDTVNVGSANPYQVTMNQNHTLKAVFVRLYALNITTTAGGTTSPAPGTHIYVNGTLVSVTAIPNTNYQLDHWELDTVNVGSANPYQVTMNQNHTLKAVFVRLYALNITTTAGGTTTPTPGIHIYSNGTDVSVAATKNTGYEFDHWKLDNVNVGTNNPYQVLMNQNHTLQALFVPSLSVSIIPAGTTTITLGNSVSFSSTVTGGTPGYSYQWYLDGSKVSGANSTSWTFDPASTGTYNVYLNVTDSRNRVAVSNTATVVVQSAPSPVGGFTVSRHETSAMLPLVFYGVVLVGLCLTVSTVRRRRRKAT
jgi:hypothetical protein